jgi:replicative DNA helicase
MLFFSSVEDREMVEVKARVAPNSRESEMMVLGCMLTSVNSLNIAADGLDDSDFYFSEHKVVFLVLKEAYKGDRPADVHLVCEELKRQEKLEGIGGPSFVAGLAQYAGTSAHIDEYVGIVKNKAVLRRMINASQIVEKKALEDPHDVTGTLDEAQALFFNIGQSANRASGILISDIFSGVKAKSEQPFLKELEERQEDYRTRGSEEAGLTGLSSSFVDLDKMINGLGNSNMIILAARPAMGKTALAVNIAENVAFASNVPVGVFSLEMSAEQLVHRIVCSRAEVESDKIRSGSLSGVEYQQIVAAVGEMQKHTMVIDDQPGLKVSDLRARARRMKETFDIGLLVVDYLQLLSGPGNARGDNRQQEISDISRGLKNLARELDIPVVVLSQLSRRVEERAGHRPMMSDLRESGSIEQDADIVMFLLRREYYDPLDKPGMAELIIAKNRHGSIGTVNLTFRKELAQFANFTPIQIGGQEAVDEEAFAPFTP